MFTKFHYVPSYMSEIMTNSAVKIYFFLYVYDFTKQFLYN